MSERVVTVGGSRASKPISDFLQTNEYFGPKGGVYYVDGNVSATGGGSPDHPYSTLAEAITASDAAIALAGNRWWARRNRIYAVGDTLTEDLVKFPTKCDIIGCGSYDANTKLGLSGHHVPIGEAYGTRIYNVHLKGKAVAGPIITLASTTSGLQLHGCTFDGTLGTMTSGILATAHPFLMVNDCDFVGTFVTSYITFGAGQAGWARITNNRMLGTAAKGIVIPGTTTASWMPLIDNNIIVATGDPIEDASDLFYVTNNRLITSANIGTTTDGYTFNLALACGNILTGLNGVAATIPFAVIAE
uniref:Pectate lyase n=2 Tax=viral metagenome TaxID=1070528 RepID=A0A6M3JCM8_9ZZZZ